MLGQAIRPGGGEDVQYPFAVILASRSPRRIGLLQAMGLEASVEPADIDETAKHGESPERLVRRLAATKALTVAAAHPHAVVLGADTVVAMGRRILAKPQDAKEAEQMLALLSGQRHQVYTGLAAYQERLGRGFIRVDVAKVTFRSLTETEISRYVATGEPMDKAGAYAIQGEAGRWVEKFEGNLETVIGLATDSVEVQLKRFLRMIKGAGEHA